LSSGFEQPHDGIGSNSPGHAGPSDQDAKLEQKSARDVVNLIDPCGSMSTEDLHADHSLAAGRPTYRGYRLDADARHLSKTRRYKNTQKNGAEKTQTNNKRRRLSLLIGPAHMAGFFVGQAIFCWTSHDGARPRTAITRPEGNLRVG
jgi:hypothetical protein